MNDSPTLFEEHFLATRGQPLVHRDRVVQMTLRLRVPPNTVMRVIRERERHQPPQGFQLSAKRGVLQVGGLRSARIVLWGDSAPEVSDVVLVSDAQTDVLLWNCWKDRNGITQAWVTNGGLSVRELTTGEWRVECNAGSRITFGPRLDSNPYRPSSGSKQAWSVSNANQRSPPGRGLSTYDRGSDRIARPGVHVQFARATAVSRANRTSLLEWDSSPAAARIRTVGGIRLSS